MTLTEMNQLPMKEVLEKCDVVEQKVHTNDDGVVMSIEVKYKPSYVPVSTKNEKHEWN